ncbi:MAG: hypothetical protein QXY18_00630 [Nitrososphaerota archaeon]
MSQEVIIKCNNCSAPLEYTPESIFIICSYCGNVNWFLEESKTQIFVIPSKNEGEVVNAFWDRMKKDEDMKKVVNELEIVDVYGVYVPIFLSRIDVSSLWNGIERKTITKNGKTRVVTIKKSGKFSDEILLSIPARRVTEEFGLEEIIEKISNNPPDHVNIEEVNWNEVKLQVLNSEISINEASDKLKDKAEDNIRKRIKKENNLSEFIFYSCDSKIKEMKLLLAPLWIISYKYKKGIYNIAISGNDLTFLKTTEPVFFYQRIFQLIGSALVTLAGIGLLSLMFKVQENITFFVIACIACFSCAYSLSRKTISDVRIERWK